MSEEVPMDLDLDDVRRLVEAIRPILGGKPPPIQGAVLADLLAIWLAGHFAGDDAANAAVREELLTAHIAMVRKLIPVNEEWMLRRREAPQDPVRQHRTGRTG
jgi:hypothetical protein